MEIKKSPRRNTNWSKEKSIDHGVKINPQRNPSAVQPKKLTDEDLYYLEREAEEIVERKHEQKSDKLAMVQVIIGIIVFGIITVALIDSYGSDSILAIIGMAGLSGGAFFLLSASDKHAKEKKAEEIKATYNDLVRKARSEKSN